MARYTGPDCRKCRRIGEKLFLKGDRCYGQKCAVDRRKRPPGDQVARRRRASEWSIHLREKQKARYTYGVLERQFRRYYKDALEQTGVTGDIILKTLERRLDNVVYRLSFVESREQGRQFVNHGYFTVNGKVIRIPSFIAKPGDIIKWKGTNGNVPEFVAVLTEGLPRRPVPRWLRLDPPTLTGEVLSLPEVSDIDTGIEARLIVEFYSR